MIGNKDSKLKYAFSFVFALILHVAIFAFVKADLHNIEFLTNLSNLTQNLKTPLKIDQIDLIKPEAVEKIRKMGIKGGKNNLANPDLGVPQQVASRPGSLSFENLAPKLPSPASARTEPSARTPLRQANNESGGHFYFNYKNQKVIPRSPEQENLKNEATRNFNAPINKATERISNFEIRYERPEGVSEDELNSDEKAYYSFYVRSYKNYFAKIYSNYEKIVLEKPALAKVFDRKHLLIGKIDYDENGNIVTVRILKSSDDDDLHYFFEETLKELNQPNPPKVFTRNRKQFSIYYQIQIN